MRKIIFLLFFLFFFLFPQKTFAAIVPVPSDPVNDSTTDTPKLIWQYSGNCMAPPANCFRVQVASSSAFSPVTKDNYTNLTSYTPQGLSFQKWYWRVEAKDSTGTWSNWSDAWSFTLIESTPTPTPTLSPAQSATPIPTSSGTTSPTSAAQNSPKLIATPIATKVGADLISGLPTDSNLLETSSALATPKNEKAEEVKTLGFSENNLPKIFLGLRFIIILISLEFYFKNRWIK